MELLGLGEGDRHDLVAVEEVPAEIVAKELEIAEAQMRDRRKPEAILEPKA